jgi:hypothetical protein
MSNIPSLILVIKIFQKELQKNEKELSTAPLDRNLGD